MGHPLGATGRDDHRHTAGRAGSRSDKEVACATLCIASGMGAATNSSSASNGTESPPVSCRCWKMAPKKGPKKILRFKVERGGRHGTYVRLYRMTAAVL